MVTNKVDEIIRLNRPRILSIARKYFQNLDDAEDATQESLLKIYRFYHTFKKDSDLWTWIYAVVANTCKDRLRPRKYVEEELLDEHYPRFDAEATAISNIEVDNIIKAISKLPQKQAELLCMLASGYTYTECASVLNVPNGTVKSRTHRARSELMEVLNGTLTIQATR